MKETTETSYYLVQEDGTLDTGVTQKSTVGELLDELGYSKERMVNDLSIYLNTLESSPEDSLKGDANNIDTVHIALQVKVDNGA